LAEAKKTYGYAFRSGKDIIVKKDGELLPLKYAEGNEMWGGDTPFQKLHEKNSRGDQGSKSTIPTSFNTILKNRSIN